MYWAKPSRNDANTASNNTDIVKVINWSSKLQNEIGGSL